MRLRSVGRPLVARRAQIDFWAISMPLALLAATRLANLLEALLR